MRTARISAFLMICCLPAAGAVGAAPAGEPQPAGADGTEIQFQFVGQGIPPEALATPDAPVYQERENLFVVMMSLAGGAGLTRENLPAMVDSTPKADLKSDTIRDLLRAGKNILSFDRGGAGGYGYGPMGAGGGMGMAPFRGPLPPAGDRIDSTEYQVVIAAASIEQGKDLARGLVAAHNAWWKKNRSGYIRDKLDGARRELADDGRKLAEKQRECESLQATLKGLWPIREPEVLAEVKARLLLLEAELAGVRARLDTARKLADPPKGTPARSEQLEAIMTTAQIDMAGLLAQQDKLSGILKAADRINVLRKDMSALEMRMKSLEADVKSLEAVTEAPFKPLRVHGTITIQPIAWGAPGQPGGGVSGAHPGGGGFPVYGPGGPPAPPRGSSMGLGPAGAPVRPRPGAPTPAP